MFQWRTLDEMPKIKVISSLETSEKVVKSLLCLDKPVIGVNCKGADLGPHGMCYYYREEIIHVY